MPSFAWRLGQARADRLVTSAGTTAPMGQRSSKAPGRMPAAAITPKAPPGFRGSGPGLRHGRSAAGLLNHADGGRRILFQLLGWTDRTGDQLSAAVRAAPAQRRLRAIPPEGAFEATDHGIGGLGRQVRVAAFAIRSELQHLGLLTGRG